MRSMTIIYGILGFICTILPATAINATSNNDNSDTSSIVANAINFATFNSAIAECKQEDDGSNVCIYREKASFLDKQAKLWAPTIEVHRDATNKIIKIVAIAISNNKAYYQSLAEVIKKSAITSTNKSNKSKQIEKNKKYDDNNDDNNRDIGMDAHADIITIYPDKHLVFLDGNASITQHGDTITSSHLEYDMNKQAITSKPQKKNEVTTIVLRPRNQVNNESTPITHLPAKTNQSL